MMDFSDIWPQFNWVINEMKDGMCFFEGYIPAINQDLLLSSLSELISKSRVHNFMYSVWSNDTTEADWTKEYTPLQRVELFHAERISHLHFDYDKEMSSIILNLKLIFCKDNGRTGLEIICYRDPILESNNPEHAVSKAITEFRYLKHLFGGDALFIGPDTLDYPTSDTQYHQLWLRIE